MAGGPPARARLACPREAVRGAGRGRIAGRRRAARRRARRRPRRRAVPRTAHGRRTARRRGEGLTVLLHSILHALRCARVQAEFLAAYPESGADDDHDPEG
ncbi:hypothetical protein F6J85_00430 [Microbacterium lushaniae]|uniref:Uncharacterized protein n=1 Tax=Microbacterium lushaniae TaxID=2614639 RepID=A0A5J6KZQ9_9MICO|nr:hypothetical protein F6J85_00430 [Microbacterium lushaniae]